MPVGTAKRIAAFYPAVFGTPAQVHNGDGTVARTLMGKNQYMQFRETDHPQGEFDGHHVQMYIADFSGPYEKLKARNLISVEDNQYQYRFQDIVDLDSGKVLFTIEHEVRSMRHPLYARPLVSRNPEQTNRIFAPGHEESAWSLPATGG